jgi:GNAT superfamily N-acetyltransferase
MYLKTLDAGELTRLYNTELVRAFPPSELKPLKSMLNLMEQNRYEALGMYDADGLHGYALTWLEPGIPFALLDYFGTLEGQRGSGLGTRMLDMLSAHYKDYRGIFGEAEGAFSADPEEKSLQERRLAFYERNGFRYGGYDCALFGVHYLTLIRGDEDVTAEELLDAHQRIYKSGIPPKVYDQFIQIPLHEGEEVRIPTEWNEE